MSTRIGVVFDFDDTLAHDSTSGLLETLGIDAEHFWRDRVQTRLDEGWDQIPAYLYELLRESRSRPPGERITAERLRAWGEQITFFTGVKTTFGQLRRAAREIDPGIEIEFYLISSGIGEVLRASSVAGEFADIWACDFHYNDAGEIEFPKNIVSFTEKTRFLFHISKGIIGPASRANVGEVNRKVLDGRFRIPLRQMIFVGDGHTDIPCFQIVKKAGGIAIAVYDPHRPSKWGKAWSFVKDDRVAMLCTANYRKRGDLHNALTMAVQDIAQSIVQAGGLQAPVPNASAPKRSAPEANQADAQTPHLHPRRRR